MNYNELLSEVSLFLEKKTQEEYMIDKLQKRWGYEPSQRNKRKGNIDVDGKRVGIDLRKASKDVYAEYDPWEDTVRINPYAISRLKGQRKYAAIQHELGHAKMHTFPIVKPSASDKSETMQTAKPLIRSRAIGLCEDKDKPATGLPYYFNKGKMNLLYRLSGVPKKSKNPNATEKRLQFINDAKKYEIKKSDHTNANEFEADRYAANRTSDYLMRKALLQIDKMNYKETPNTKLYASNILQPEIIKMYPDKEERKKYLKSQDYKDAVKETRELLASGKASSSADIYARLAALKDPKLASNEYYKPAPRPKVSSSAYQKSKNKSKKK